MFVSFVDLYLFSFPLSYWLYIILFHMSSDFVCVCVCVEYMWQVNQNWTVILFSSTSQIANLS